MARRIKPILWTSPMPPCDICTGKGAKPVRDGIYDSPTVNGPWGNLCHTHMREYSPPNCQIVAMRCPPQKYHDIMTKQSSQPQSGRP